MKYCVACSAENDDNAVRCRVCNGLFFTRTTSNAPAPQPDQRILCSNCKQYVSAAGFVCPHCGYDLEHSRADARVTRHLKLRHRSGGEIILASGDILGRQFTGKDLLSRDPYISGAHIKVEQAGKFFALTDLSGQNSFFVNMVPIAPGGTAIVEDRDVIKIGTTDLVVSIFV